MMLTLLCLFALAHASIPVQPLSYALDSLEPHVSHETMSLHHGKHYSGYVAKLNALIVGTPFEQQSLESIVRESVSGSAIFNNAAQAFNHEFYWRSMAPKSLGGGSPPASGAFLDAVNAQYGSLDQLQALMSKVAVAHFGSGWVWLVQHNEAPFLLDVIDTHDAGCPLTRMPQVSPLLVLDVWEHAYYVDQRNRRDLYVAAFWSVANWAHAQSRYVAHVSEADQEL